MNLSIGQRISNFLNLFTEEITICIPAYNASDFILETISSVQKQIYQNFRCIISVDQSTDDTYELINSSINDRRFKWFRQKSRLGWAGNINFLLNKVRSKYFFILPHDDVLHPNYIRNMLPIIKSDQSIVVVYSDIQTFGMEHNSQISQNSIRGTKLERTKDYLNNHYNAVHFRGIVNRKKAGNAIWCSSNSMRDFAEDTIWGLQLVLRGDFVRYPEVLYHKRYSNTSYHYSWQQWSNEEKIKAWQLHCRRCAETVLSENDLKKYDTTIHEAILHRVLQSHQDLWYRDILGKHQDELIESFRINSP